MHYRFVLILMMSLLSFTGLIAQNAETDALLEEGIRLHDKGDFQGAIARYDAILEQIPDDFGAMTEKSMSLFMSGKNEQCIDLCEHIIKVHKAEENLYLVYTTLGNALDNAGKPKEAIDAYERGIERFPDHYMLHFNLGITYMREGDADRGIASLIRDLQVNPYHPGGNYALGVALLTMDRRGAALLALSRLVVLEFGTDRTEMALGLIQQILAGNAEKTGRKSTTIRLSAPEEEGSDDDFAPVDLMITMLAVADQDKKVKKAKKKMSDVEVLSHRLESIYGLCAELYKDGSLKGPVSDLYCPFFTQLTETDHTLTLTYVMFAANEEKYIQKWHEENRESVEELIKMSFEQGEKD